MHLSYRLHLTITKMTFVLASESNDFY